MKAYLRGKSSFTYGTEEVDGITRPRTINITSNEFDLHRKSEGGSTKS